jgi:hypothetical protein
MMHLLLAVADIWVLVYHAALAAVMTILAFMWRWMFVAIGLGVEAIIVWAWIVSPKKGEISRVDD